MPWLRLVPASPLRQPSLLQPSYSQLLSLLPGPVRLQRCAPQFLRSVLLPRPAQCRPPRVQRRPSRQRPSTRQLWPPYAWPRLPALQRSSLRQRHVPALRSTPWDVLVCQQQPEQALMPWLRHQPWASSQTTHLRSRRVQLHSRCARARPSHRQKPTSSMLTSLARPLLALPLVSGASMLCVRPLCSRRRRARQVYELRRASEPESCGPEAFAVPSLARQPPTARHRRQVGVRQACESRACELPAYESQVRDPLPCAAPVQAAWNRIEYPWCAPPEQYAAWPPPPGNPHLPRASFRTHSMQMTSIQMLSVTTHRWQHHPVRRSMRHLAEKAVVQKSLR